MFDTNPPKIIFFTADAQPTQAEMLDMLNYGHNVMVRNARYIADTDGREECDGVAGAVPSIYAGAPTGDEALAAYKEKVKARMALVGDSPAPQAAEQHAVRLMGKRTAPGPDDIKELPETPAPLDPDAVVHPAADGEQPVVEIPAQAEEVKPPVKGWKAGK